MMRPRTRSACRAPSSHQPARHGSEKKRAKKVVEAVAAADLRVDVNPSTLKRVRVTSKPSGSLCGASRTRDSSEDEPRAKRQALERPVTRSMSGRCVVDREDSSVAMICKDMAIHGTPHLTTGDSASRPRSGGSACTAAPSPSPSTSPSPSPSSSTMVMSESTTASPSTGGGAEVGAHGSQVRSFVYSDGSRYAG